MNYKKHETQALLEHVCAAFLQNTTLATLADS
jgi:hypothetical protein